MERQFERSRRYQKIDFEQRNLLIKRVCQEKKTIVEAAGEIGIHPSTARMIIVKYKENGTIFEKKEDKTKRELG